MSNRYINGEFIKDKCGKFINDLEQINKSHDAEMQISHSLPHMVNTILIFQKDAISFSMEISYGNLKHIHKHTNKITHIILISFKMSRRHSHYKGNNSNTLKFKMC